MLRRFALFFALSLAVPLAHAETLDFNLSDDAVRAELSGPLPFGDQRGAEYNFGYLYSDKRDARLNVGHIGMMVIGDAGARDANVHVGIGLRGTVISMRGGNNGGAVAVGAKFDVRLPQFNRIGLIGNVHFSPKVLSFNDVERYSDLTVAIDYEIIRNASVYAGFRDVRVKLEDVGGSNLRDNSPILGLRLTF